MIFVHSISFIGLVGAGLLGSLGLRGERHGRGRTIVVQEIFGTNYQYPILQL